MDKKDLHLDIKLHNAIHDTIGIFTQEATPRDALTRMKLIGLQIKLSQQLENFVLSHINGGELSK